MLAGVGYEIACPSSTLRIGRLSKRFIFYATLPKGTRLKKKPGFWPFPFGRDACAGFYPATPKGLRSTEGTRRCAVILALREASPASVLKNSLRSFPPQHRAQAKKRMKSYLHKLTKKHCLRSQVHLGHSPAE